MVLWQLKWGNVGRGCVHLLLPTIQRLPGALQPPSVASNCSGLLQRPSRTIQSMASAYETLASGCEDPCPGLPDGASVMLFAGLLPIAGPTKSCKGKPGPPCQPLPRQRATGSRRRHRARRTTPPLHGVTGLATVAGAHGSCCCCQGCGGSNPPPPAPPSQLNPCGGCSCPLSAHDCWAGDNSDIEG